MKHGGTAVACRLPTRGRVPSVSDACWHPLCLMTVDTPELPCTAAEQRERAALILGCVHFRHWLVHLLLSGTGQGQGWSAEQPRAWGLRTLGRTELSDICRFFPPNCPLPSASVPGQDVCWRGSTRHARRPWVGAVPGAVGVRGDPVRSVRGRCRCRHRSRGAGQGGRRQRQQRGGLLAGRASRAPSKRSPSL